MLAEPGRQPHNRRMRFPNPVSGRCLPVILCFCVVGLLPAHRVPAETFAVMAYNVENLFDLDGVAVFDDYALAEEGGGEDDTSGYGRRKLLTKLRAIVRMLERFNSGKGPEIVLFQELEADFTPESGMESPEAFLRRHNGTPVEAMLGDQWRSEYAGIPAAGWLLKALADAGMRGYAPVTAPAKAVDAGIAHTNAVFSKFPVRSVRRHPTEKARDILEVELSVRGHPFVVFVNHWKSGASNPEREPIRVKNGRDLLSVLEARLEDDPFADILLGGDFNSHYNHSRLYPELTTGINDVLGSQGDEAALLRRDGPELYNLWYELPPEKRFSEVWRGRRGTLMHIMVTRGLYDKHGVRYVDGSFRVVSVRGLNADALGRPMGWHFAGTGGGGVSDHFPLVARFTIGSGRPGDFVRLREASRGGDAPDYEIPLRYEGQTDLLLPDGRFLNDVPGARLGPYVGRLYRIRGEISGVRPMKLRIGGEIWDAYIPSERLYERLVGREGGTLSLVARLGVWKGERQWVVEGIYGKSPSADE